MYFISELPFFHYSSTEVKDGKYLFTFQVTSNVLIQLLQRYNVLDMSPVLVTENYDFAAFSCRDS
jgi:hypothetical protein